MKKALSLLVALSLVFPLLPAALGAEAVPAPPSWVAAEDHVTFPGDPVYEPENWEGVLSRRQEAEKGALLPQEGRDWAEGSPGACYETALIRLKCAENYGEDDLEARAAFLAAGKAFEAAESAWYDQNRGRDERYYRLRVEKYRAYLLYHPEYVDNWGQAIVPALDALGMTMDEFFDGAYMERVSGETREAVERSADAYWSFYLPEKSRITVYLDGALLQMDTSPQVRNQRVMTPIRALAEALGAEVDWDPESWEVTLTRAGSTLSMTPGKTTAWVDGQAVEMDVAPYADQNRTYFPVRYAAELFGQTVSWNAAQRRVDVAEAKPEENTLEEWAVSMGALLTVAEGGDPARFGAFQRAAGSRGGAARCREILGGKWNVPDRESLLKTVEEILTEGNQKDFQAAAGKVKHLSYEEIARRTSRMEEENKYMWPRAKALWEKWGERGILAWDLCRVAALCQWGYSAGYLTYPEALEQLRPAAEKLAEEFDGWDKVYENFLEGYYWCLREDLGDKTVWATDLGMMYLYLRSSPDTRTLFDSGMFKKTPV